MKTKKTYSGVVLDKVTGVNAHTRRGWAKRGVLSGDGDGYDHEDLLRAAVGMETARAGINSKGTRDYLIRLAVEDMQAMPASEPVSAEPRYMVAAPPTDIENEIPTPGPMNRRMMDGLRGKATFVALADGAGGLYIGLGFTAAELAEHFAVLAKAGEVASFVLDTAGLLRRINARLAEVESEAK
ncbi:MAG TPA: hypothetical protein VGK67_31380 [Myxococcales bacterium]|jgi:hypothetical protein